jgi:hypothetical protein
MASLISGDDRCRSSTAEGTRKPSAARDVTGPVTTGNRRMRRVTGTANLAIRDDSARSLEKVRSLSLRWEHIRHGPRDQACVDERILGLTSLRRRNKRERRHRMSHQELHATLETPLAQDERQVCMAGRVQSVQRRCARNSHHLYTSKSAKVQNRPGPSANSRHQYSITGHFLRQVLCKLFCPYPISHTLRPTPPTRGCGSRGRRPGQWRPGAA